MAGAPISVAPGKRSETLCECCGDRSHTIWGELLDARRATVAIYYAGWVESADHPDIYLTLSLGPWGNGTAGADRENIPIVAFWDAGSWQFGAHDHGRLTGDAALLGKRLGREKTLAHGRIDEIWALCDAVWADDPRIAEATDRRSR